MPKETAQAARLRREAALAAVINNEPRAEISDPGENAPRQQPESGGRGAGSPAVPAPEATKELSKADKAAAALESATAEKEAADVQYAGLAAAADVAKQEYHEAAAKAHIAALDHDTGKATHDDVVNSSSGTGSTSDAESQENANDDQTAIELLDLHRLAAAERVGLAQQRVEAADAALKKAMKKYNKAVKSADPVDEIGQDDDKATGASSDPVTPEPEIPTTEEEDRKRAFASTRIQALLRGHLARAKTTAADVTKTTTTSAGDTAVPEGVDTTEKTQPETADVADDIQMEDPPGSQGESQERRMKPST